MSWRCRQLKADQNEEKSLNATSLTVLKYLITIWKLLYETRHPGILLDLRFFDWLEWNILH